MRHPPASEILNRRLPTCSRGQEEIKSSLISIDELGISFDYRGEVSAQDAEEILEKIVSLHRRAVVAAGKADSQERIDALRLFAANLEKAFHGFEPHFFQHHLSADR